MKTQITPKTHTLSAHTNWQQWGMYGFLFFFLKGMLWLVTPFLIYQLQ